MTKSDGTVYICNCLSVVRSDVPMQLRFLMPIDFAFSRWILSVLEKQVDARTPSPSPGILHYLNTSLSIIFLLSSFCSSHSSFLRLRSSLKTLCFQKTSAIADSLRRKYILYGTLSILFSIPYPPWEFFGVSSSTFVSSGFVRRSLAILTTFYSIRCAM